MTLRRFLLSGTFVLTALSVHAREYDQTAIVCYNQDQRGDYDELYLVAQNSPSEDAIMLASLAVHPNPNQKKLTETQLQPGFKLRRTDAGTLKLAGRLAAPGVIGTWPVDIRFHAGTQRVSMLGQNLECQVSAALFDDEFWMPTGG